MLDIVVATNNDTILTRNLLRSHVLKGPGVGLHVQKGFSSAARAYNDALDQCRNELIVFAHQDVYLPSGWHDQLLKSLEFLDKTDPLWAVLGVYGVTALGIHAGYVWSSGLNRLLGQPFETPQPVVSIDELLIVLRMSSGVRFDVGLPGFHLYGTDIVQTSLAVGRSAYVICAPVVHNSRPVFYLPGEYLRAHDYAVRKWRSKLPIPNCVAPLVTSPIARWNLHARHRLLQLRHAQINRASYDRHLDCEEIAKQVGFGLPDFRS